MSGAPQQRDCHSPCNGFPHAPGQEKARVLITGAAGRLGAWIARDFARHNAEIWLIDKDEAGLKALVRDLEERPARAPQASPEKSPPALWTVLDLLSENAIADFHDEVASRWGAPTALINNAGAYPSTPLAETGADAWDALMALNLRAVHLMTQFSARLMIAGEVPGSIVNIISRSARIPRLHSVPYAVSKAGVEMLTRGYAMELAPRGIRVNAVSPGLIPGGKTGALGANYLEAARGNIPLGRFSGPEDAPAAVRFLCSPDASFITGTSLFVDGGSNAGDIRLPPQTQVQTRAQTQARAQAAGAPSDFATGPEVERAGQC